MLNLKTGVTSVMDSFRTVEYILGDVESWPTYVINTRVVQKFLYFYIFAGNGEGGRSSNWSCLRVSCD